MKKFAVVMALFVTMHPAVAGISSGWSSGPVVVVAVPEPRTVPLFLVVPADFVSVPIRVISEQKNSALAYEETRMAIDLISKKAEESGRFRTTMGAVSLSHHRSHSQTLVIVPLTDAYENKDAGFFAVGRSGCNGIDFGYRTGQAGLWAYYPITREFKFMSPTVARLVEGWCSGELSV
jgi:hypothetical protein